MHGFFFFFTFVGHNEASWCASGVVVSFSFRGKDLSLSYLLEFVATTKS